jgi:DNA repair protein RadC
LVVAAAVLARVGGLAGLGRSDPHELARLEGIGPARAVRIHAALTLGARAVRQRRGEVLGNAEAAFRLLGPSFRGLGVEELHAAYLDRRGRLLAARMLTRGSDGFTVVDARQIFRPAVQVGASALVLAHNHPSGDPTPSAQDREVTRRIAAAGRALGVQLLDHLVVAGESWTSLASAGDLPAWVDEPTWTA